MTGEPDSSLPRLFSTTLEGGRGATPDPRSRERRRKAPSRIVVGLLGLAAVGAGLLPLYGDSRAAPLTHPLWARMLLRGLEMSDAVRAGERASQVFSFLSWRESLAFAADGFAEADGVVSRGDGTVTAADGVGEVVYPLAVVRQGDYRLRVRSTGRPGTTATAELAQMGGRVFGGFTFAPGTDPGWVMGEATHLDRGTYNASVLLPPGCSLEYVEVAPPCLNSIEPPGGWNPTAVTSVEDLAVTVLKAIDREDALPPADLPSELTGGDFQVEGPGGAVAPTSVSELEARWLRAGRDGLVAVVFVDLPESGLYTLSAFGVTGEGQRWMADGCRKAVLCRDGSTTPSWRSVMTQPLQAGRHYFSVTLAPGAAIERVRLERKSDAPGDYLETLRTLGFDAGAAGPVARERAVEAMRFVSRQVEQAAMECGDVRLPAMPQTVSTGLPGAAGAGAVVPGGGGVLPGGGLPGVPAGPPPLAIPPPQVPPQPPSSPVLPQG